MPHHAGEGGSLAGTVLWLYGYQWSGEEAVLSVGKGRFPTHLTRELGGLQGGRAKK